MPANAKAASSTSFINLVLLVLVPFPSILLWRWSIGSCSGYSLSNTSVPAQWCNIFNNSAFWAVNICFLLNVDVVFWLISLWQKSTWLIDPYWTLIPPLIGLAYKSHPGQCGDSGRLSVLTWLVAVWSIRLTHSYFRREKWSVEGREDWRYSDMRTKYGGFWWFISFFAVYISQHTMLIGVTLPLWIASLSKQPFMVLWDTLAAVTCYTGIFIAWRADSQLHHFVTQNSRRRKQGLAPYPVMQEGLWRFSRHPNYFGELLFWWGIALFAFNLGQWWAIVGAIWNTLIMLAVTKLTEERMLKVSHRKEAYARYMTMTSMWVPWQRTPLSPSKA